MSYIKENVSFKEFMMHEYIYNLSLNSNGVLNVPRITDYDAETKVMTMDNIPQMCVADFYGEDASGIDAALFSKIREAIRFLYINRIVYPDITGYNFIECGDTLWVIDFEHSDFETEEKNIFVEEFVHSNDYNVWNPWFL
jgi:tRNA A-37 threonylcarbamoyl transferase component Bud32